MLDINLTEQLKLPANWIFISHTVFQAQELSSLSCNEICVRSNN